MRETPHPSLPPPHSMSSSRLSPLLCPSVNGGIPSIFHFNSSSWGRDWGRCLVRTSRPCHCPRLWRQAAQSSLWMPTEIHPHLCSLFSSSRCILLSVISNRLKVTAAKAAAALHNRLSLSISDTQTHTFSHTHTQTECEAPSGLKVLSQSSGDTTAVKLPTSPNLKLRYHMFYSSLLLSLPLTRRHPPFSLPQPPPTLSLTDTVRPSDALKGPTSALSYSLVVGGGLNLQQRRAVSSTQLSMRLGRGHPLRKIKEEGGRKSGRGRSDCVCMCVWDLKKKGRKLPC